MYIGRVSVWKFTLVEELLPFPKLPTIEAGERRAKDMKGAGSGPFCRIRSTNEYCRAAT